MIQAHKSVQVMKRENKTEGPWLMVGTNEISCIILVIGVCNLKKKCFLYLEVEQSRENLIYHTVYV